MEEMKEGEEISAATEKAVFQKGLIGNAYVESRALCFSPSTKWSSPQDDACELREGIWK